MKIQTILSITLVIFLIASCATTYQITSDYEKETVFNTFKTYNYLNHEHNFPLGANPINEQRIGRAIESELGNLGYKKSDDPDLLVSWFITVKNVKEVDYYHNWYGRWRYFPMVSVNEYQEGTLVVDLIDKKNNLVVWHGKTSDRVYEDMPDVEEKIKEAVGAMFKKYAKDTKWKKKDYALN